VLDIGYSSFLLHYFGHGFVTDTIKKVPELSSHLHDILLLWNVWVLCYILTMAEISKEEFKKWSLAWKNASSVVKAEEASVLRSPD
jgi:hypothetical protein